MLTAVLQKNEVFRPNPEITVVLNFKGQHLDTGIGLINCWCCILKGPTAGERLDLGLSNGQPDAG